MRLTEAEVTSAAALIGAPVEGIESTQLIKFDGVNAL